MPMSDECYGRAFESVGRNLELFLANLYARIRFTLEHDIIQEFMFHLNDFSVSHIKVLHKNILQKKEMEKHAWIESEKQQRDVGFEAKLEWIQKYGPLFNEYYERTYGHLFVDSDY